MTHLAIAVQGLVRSDLACRSERGERARWCQRVVTAGNAPAASLLPGECGRRRQGDSPPQRGRARRCEGGHRCTGADVPYRRMPSELGVRAGASRDVTSAPRPFAPGLLRPTTLGLVRHPVGLATPDRAAARGQPSTQPPADIVQLCPPPGTSCGSPPGSLRDDAPRHPGGLPVRRGRMFS